MPTRPPARRSRSPAPGSTTCWSDPITWLSDNRHILAVLVPGGPRPGPRRTEAPIGPNVQESSGRLSQMATFQDLLTSPHDEDLFAAFRHRPARPHRHRDRADRADRPGRLDHRRRTFARREVPARQHGSPPVFLPRALRLLHAQDRGLGRERPAGRHDRRPADLRRRSPPGRADRARARIQWQPLHEARLLWTEALDGGDPRTKVAHRDKVMASDAPFTGKPAEVMKFQHRFAGFAVAPGERPRPGDGVRPRPSLANHGPGRPQPARGIAQGPLRPEHQRRLQGPRLPDHRHPAGRRHDDPPGRRFDLPDRARVPRPKGRGRFSIR